jgi:hypothetical protein
VSLARLVGVARPHEVRVRLVPRVPAPEHPELLRACQALGFLGPGTLGLTLGRGVFLRRGHEADRLLLAHELRHVAQYEREGGIAAYIALYLRDLLQHGYDRAPFELDACAAAARAVHQA